MANKLGGKKNENREIPYDPIGKPKIANQNRFVDAGTVP